MAYADDLAAASRWYKLRLAAVVLAVGLSLLGVALEIHWFHIPRAAAWAAGGLFSILEGRAQGRLGRDGDGCYLRAALLALLAIGCFVWLD
jgi:hypothetical protein